MGKNMESALQEMKKLKAKLPPRPSPEDLGNATRVIEEEDSSVGTLLDQLQAPYRVYGAYLQMREDLIRKKAQDRKRDYVAIQELDDMHKRFEALIQGAQSAASHALTNNALPTVSEDTSLSPSFSSTPSSVQLGSRSFEASTSTVNLDSSANNFSRRTIPQEAPIAGPHPDHEDHQDGARRYSPKVLSAIEEAKKQKLTELKLSNMELERIPKLTGGLTNLNSLDLSGNHLKALPESIGVLSKLSYLNVESNSLTELPETIGCLTNLRILNIQINKIEELPITIGLCTRLVELIATFNNLKVLPEAMGNLTSLEKLNINWNGVQRLPTTLPNLTNLVELDVHYNRLESIPDSLCHLPNLTILDVSSNYIALRELPEAIGDMPSIRELKISNNSISTLPASFAKLTGLQKLELVPNPWMLPPLDVAQKGKEAVLQFMANIMEKTKKPSFGSRLSTVISKKRTSSSPHGQTGESTQH